MGTPLTRSAIAKAALGGLLLGAAIVLLFMRPDSGRADSLPCQAPNRGFDFDTLEVEDYVTWYNRAIELATAGKAVTFSYSPAPGETVDVTYQGLKSGPRGARQVESTALSIPPSVYKSIAWIEANWSNASSSVPYGGVGPVLLSGDCGYGIGQITSGMGHMAAPPALAIDVPTAQQAIIGTDFLFNIAQGVRILADKWNSAPGFRPIAGTGDPSALEDWYFAIWSYNGFAFSNHPLNPNRNPLRGGSLSPIYHCYDPSGPGYGTFAYGDYTYQERVYGCMRYPPKDKSASTSRLTAQEAQAPRFAPGDSAVVNGGGDCVNLRPTAGTGQKEITCLADGTKVTILGGPSGMVSGYIWWNVSTPGGNGWMADPFLAEPSSGGDGGNGGGTPAPSPPLGPPGTPPPTSPAGRMWLPQVFNMPDFTNETVASAFAPQNFLDCSDASFAGGCPKMDFPTTIPAANPPLAAHRDSTPAPNTAWLSQLLGDPRLQVTGPGTATLIAHGDGSASSTTLTVSNAGTWIAPFRIQTSADWIRVRHPNDPPARTLDGSLAVGKETQVVTLASPTRVARQGYDSVLLVTLDPSVLPPGTTTGTVTITPLLGSGSTFTLTVIATNAGGSSYRAVLPGIAGDGP